MTLGPIKLQMRRTGTIDLLLVGSILQQARLPLPLLRRMGSVKRPAIHGHPWGEEGLA